jgi:glycosyltransferase involved in cell wall biosynthesis
LGVRPHRVLIISAGDGFPNGTGSAARVRAYAKGLQAAGVDVKVLTMVVGRPGHDRAGNDTVAGEWQGIPFEYMSGTVTGQSGWLRRRVRELGTSRAIASAIRDSARLAPTAVIFFGTIWSWTLPVSRACRSAGVPLIGDRSESPFVYEGEPGPLEARRRRFYLDNFFRLFDGMVAISSHLENLLRPLLKPGTWLLRIPILVRADDFLCEGEPEPGLVGYVGNLGHAEELDHLALGVATVAADHPEARARVFGGGSTDRMQQLQERFAGLGTQGRIELAGAIPAAAVPAALCRCSALALPRASGLFSTAGMPTKLGEYLATGRPVVVTATGDISDYLTDGVDAYVVPPEDDAALATALASALFDPTSATVGAAGRATATREFDPERHMRRLLDAIETDGRGDTLS